MQSSEEGAIVSQYLEARLGFTLKINFIWGLENKFQYIK